MHVEGGTKSNGHVREGRWIGINEKSKGCRVYWPDRGSVTVERNLHFDETGASAECLEGEDWDCVDPSSDSLTSNFTPDPTLAPAASTSTTPAPALDNEPMAKHVRKPSQRIQDILAGRGVTSTCPSNPQVAPGIQLPTVNETVEFEGEVTADWIMLSDFVEEYAMAAEISDAEALEPRTLAEAKCRPDWPLWENAIQEEL